MFSIAENLERIHASIEKIKGKNSPITVVAVTKFQPVEKIHEAIRCGIKNLGVNYAQDGDLLREELKNEKLLWHFIGHIQSRKVKYLSSYDLVQSIDRIELLKTLQEKAQGEGKKISVLVELNMGGESSKSGIVPDSLESFLEQATVFPAIRIRGLMCMPPALESLEDRRPFFKKTYEIYQRLQKPHSFDTLSMGTSEDFETALEEGANMVRLGTTLFGPRPAKTV